MNSPKLSSLVHLCVTLPKVSETKPKEIKLDETNTDFFKAHGMAQLYQGRLRASDGKLISAAVVHVQHHWTEIQIVKGLPLDQLRSCPITSFHCSESAAYRSTCDTPNKPEAESSFIAPRRENNPQPNIGNGELTFGWASPEQQSSLMGHVPIPKGYVTIPKGCVPTPKSSLPKTELTSEARTDFRIDFSRKLYDFLHLLIHTPKIRLEFEDAFSNQLILNTNHFCKVVGELTQKIINKNYKPILEMFCSVKKEQIKKEILKQKHKEYIKSLGLSVFQKFRLSMGCLEITKPFTYNEIEIDQAVELELEKHIPTLTIQAKSQAYAQITNNDICDEYAKEKTTLLLNKHLNKTIAQIVEDRLKAVDNHTATIEEQFKVLDAQIEMYTKGGIKPDYLIDCKEGLRSELLNMYQGNQQNLSQYISDNL